MFQTPDAGNATGGATGGAADAPKRTRKPAAPIENPDTLSGEALTKFNALPEYKRQEWRAKFMLQEARKRAEEDKASKPARQPRLPAPPAFTLSHSFGMLSKTQIVPPADGAQTDAGALRIAKDFGIIAPLLVALASDGSGRYELMDSRDYGLIPEDKTVPAVIVSGFPSDEWKEAAAVVTQSARPVNVFGVAALLARLRARGWEDKRLRSRLGLKAAEIAKLEKLANLPENIRAGVATGRVTPNVAILVSKQTDAIRARLSEVFDAKTKEKADSRLTEADVEEARKARTDEAIKRDQGTLLGAVADAPATVDEAATGAAAMAEAGASGGAAVAVQPAPAEAQPAPVQPAPAGDASAPAVADASAPAEGSGGNP